MNGFVLHVFPASAPRLGQSFAMCEAGIGMCRVCPPLRTCLTMLGSVLVRP